LFYYSDLVIGLLERCTAIYFENLKEVQVIEGEECFGYKRGVQYGTPRRSRLPDLGLFGTFLDLYGLCVLLFSAAEKTREKTSDWTQAMTYFCIINR
jgi:hypothetical protein